MTITTADLLYCLSGGAGNTDPDASIGGSKSDTTISDDVSENLFDHVTAAEASSGEEEYRGIFLMNTSSETLSSAKVYISVNTPSADDSIEIATDSAGINDDDSMSSVSDEDTSASEAGTWTEGTLTIGDMLPTKSIGIWVKRTVSSGAGAQADNTATFVFEGETA